MQVVALPLPHRPLFPGFYMPIYVKNRPSDSVNVKGYHIVYHPAVPLFSYLVLHQFEMIYIQRFADIVFIPLQDPKLLAALVESRKRQAPYAGAFLLKDEPGTDPRIISGSDADKNVHDLKGKELFNRLHEVGTLAQITSIQGDQVILIGHRRLRITELVSESSYQCLKIVTYPE
ncbi:unnamed protein product [Thlaspi arvense]|uniref:Lon N-terminal domain-containing protein n=1 Tax=Thlaspi arvense TaxID=13288 RepID=A0AAU9SZ78_THLAR|nr:unnamed protein product [Thlaspi arvense]